VIGECCATITIYNGSRRTLTYGSGCIHYEGYVRTALATPLNTYQAGSFERTQRTALGIRLYAPLLQHQVGNREGIGLPKFFKVPECQPNQ
jgi:hypothetical protein